MNRIVSIFCRKKLLYNGLIKPPKTYKCDYKVGDYQYQALPLLPWLQFAFRTGIMLSGRLINRWWRNLPEVEKLKLIKKLKRNSKALGAVGCVIVGTNLAIYYSHVEECVYTGRKRFMAISERELIEITGDSMMQNLFAHSEMLPTNHPHYKFVKAIIDTIVSKNQAHYPALTRHWKLSICQDNSIINAACLPTGEVIVFTGLINFVENHHQLAVILAHELSHVILEHGRETISRSSLIAIWMTVVGFVLWTVVPGDLMAFFSNWLKNRIRKICLELPYNRMLESEADVLGLKLVARACFNLKEAKRFWELMDTFEKQTGDKLPNWLSTHPRSILRAKQLENLTPAAEKISRDCGCVSESWLSANMIRQYLRFA